MPSTTVPRTSSYITHETPTPQKTDDDVWSLPTLSGDCLTMTIESALEQLFPCQGVLLVNEMGKPVQSNTKAREICQALHQSSESPMTMSTTDQTAFALPSQVATLCEFLQEVRYELPDQPLQLSEDIFLETRLRVQLKAEWRKLGSQDQPYILVRLEDITQIAGQRALCDTIRYGLTQREADVWKLYLQGLSRQQVGDKLFIALSTVKKHLKNIQSKRRGEVF